MNPPDIVFLGAPGSGKGTQAQILRERFGYDQISTGDILREHRQRGTELGMAAEGYMRRGELVPDDLMIAMVKGALPPPERAAVFDGFPRTVAQAKALDGLLVENRRGLPHAMYFRIDRTLLEQRLTGRWTNPRTGRVYHERFNPPKVAGVDDDDGGPLVQREDDKPETVLRRLDVFEAQTLPLRAYYGAARLTEIDAAQAIDAVTARILAALRIEAA